MVKKLTALELAEHAPYRGVALTPAGERVALEVIRHHRLLELYLAETLGVSVDDVHEEADRLEHVLSEELEARIDRRSASRRTIRTETRSRTRTSSGPPGVELRGASEEPALERLQALLARERPACSDAAVLLATP